MRARADRLHEFASIDDVEATLQHLAPLVQEIPRRPGQKEARCTHTLSGVTAEFGRPADIAAPAEADVHTGEPLSARVQRLEEQVAALTTELAALKAKLGE